MTVLRDRAVPLLLAALLVLAALLAFQQSRLRGAEARYAQAQAGLEEARLALQTAQADRAGLQGELAELQSAYEAATTPVPPDNPIDAFFRPHLGHAPTPALGYLYYRYGLAWQAELHARARRQEEQLVYPADKEVLSGYLAAVEAEAGAVNSLAWLFEADKDITPEDNSRYFNSGTGFRARIEAETAQVYRDAVYRDFYYWGPYTFDEAAVRAELEQGGWTCILETQETKE